MPDENSSSSLISPPMRNVRHRARHPLLSHPWRWRRSVVSTLCSISSATSTASRELNVFAIRQRLSVPLVDELESWMRQERAKFSRHNDVAQAMDYMLKRWRAFTRFLHDGRICLTNNAAERALRGIALGKEAPGRAKPGRGLSFLARSGT